MGTKVNRKGQERNGGLMGGTIRDERMSGIDLGREERGAFHMGHVRDEMETEGTNRVERTEQRPLQLHVLQHAGANK